MYSACVTEYPNKLSRVVSTAPYQSLCMYVCICMYVGIIVIQIDIPYIHTYQLLTLVEYVVYIKSAERITAQVSDIAQVYELPTIQLKSFKSQNNM